MGVGRTGGAGVSTVLDATGSGLGEEVLEKLRADPDRGGRGGAAEGPNKGEAVTDAVADATTELVRDGTSEPGFEGEAFRSGGTGLEEASCESSTETAVDSLKGISSWVSAPDVLRASTLAASSCTSLAIRAGEGTGDTISAGRGDNGKEPGIVVAVFALALAGLAMLDAILGGGSVLTGVSSLGKGRGFGGTRGEEVLETGGEGLGDDVEREQRRLLPPSSSFAGSGGRCWLKSR
jgi:hypothetical protein